MSRAKDFLKQIGVIVDTSHLSYVNDWRALYECEGSRFYEQRVLVKKEDGSGAIVKNNTVTTDRRKKYSYKAHIQACRKWAGLIFNEETVLQVSEPEQVKVDVSKANTETQEQQNPAAKELAFLEQHYEDAGVWPMLEENFPEMFGMGTIGVVTEFSADFGIVHKWYSAEDILPIETCQGRIRSAVFVSCFEWTDGKKYTLYNIHEEQRQPRIQAHGVKGIKAGAGAVSGYRVRNVIVAENGDKALEPGAFGIVEEYTTPYRLFAIFKPFNRKISNFNNAFGIPIYFDHEDMIAEIDEIYDVKQIDLQTSRRNIFIDKDALTYDKHGRSNIPQHLYGTIVSTNSLEGHGGELKSNFITEFAPEPHMDKYSLELQAALNRFSDAVGLGTEAFKIERGQKATATQVVSESQEKYTNLKKHLSILSSEFMVFNRAILAVARDFEFESVDPDKAIGFFIQDSVVVDDETRRETALTEVREGLRSVRNYLEEFRGLSGEELETELGLLESASGGSLDEIAALLKGNQGNAETDKEDEEKQDPDAKKDSEQDEAKQ